MRTRFIIIIAALVIAVGVIFYFIFFGTAAPSTPTTGQTGSLPVAPTVPGSGAQLPGASSTVPLGSIGSSVAIVDAGPIAGYFASSTGAVTVMRSDGTILNIANGQTLSLSSSSISDVITAVFSFDGRKIAVSSGGASNPQTSIFDTQSRTWTQLSTGMLSPVWSPLDYRLAFLRNGGTGTESLNLIDFGKAKPAPTVLGTWFVQDMGLQWTMPGIIMLSGRPSAFDNTSVLAFNLAKATIAPVVVSHTGFSAIWNAVPQMGLAFGTTPAQRGGHLQLIDVSGAVFQNLSFLTLPSKCAFGQVIIAATSSISQIAPPPSPAATKSSSSLSVTPPLSFQLVLYCAVPNDQATLSYYPLPDAYLEHAISTNDTLYRVNTTTGHIDTVLSGLTSGLEATTLHSAGSKLYFVNWYDKKLYSVTTP